jgi:hypothetical protein
VSLVILIAFGASPPAKKSSPPGPETLHGRVLLLPDVLKARKVNAKPDLGPIANQAVLLDQAGNVVPLFSDDASRALFLDERLRDRPAELKCQRFDGLPYVQVLTFKVEREGRLETPEYFCEICAISVRFPQICPCCQGPMILRAKPDR